MGLRKTPYISQDEMKEFLAIGAFCGEAEKVAESTADGAWRRRLKTAVTNMEKVIDERVASLDKDQYTSVLRRKKNTRILMRSIDEKRFEPELAKEIIQVDQEDMMELAELALNSCTVCKQGECVKGCRFRIVMHRLCVPVVNDNPKEGYCEFFTQDFKTGAENEG